LDVEVPLVYSRKLLEVLAVTGFMLNVSEIR